MGCYRWSGAAVVDMYHPKYDLGGGGTGIESLAGRSRWFFVIVRVDRAKLGLLLPFESVVAMRGFVWFGGVFFFGEGKCVVPKCGC